METQQLPLILVVEDEPDIANLLTLVIRRTGHQVLLATRGAAALEYLESIKPALITLDISLPDMSGTDVLARIRQQPALDHVPVVIVSAVPGISPALHPAVQGVVTKPFTLDELVAAIQPFLLSEHGSAGLAERAVGDGRGGISPR